MSFYKYANGAPFSPLAVSPGTLDEEGHRPRVPKIYGRLKNMVKGCELGPASQSSIDECFKPYFFNAGVWKMAPNVVVVSVLLVIAFGLFVDGHTLYRRDVDELLDLKHDHDDADVTTTPSSQQDNVSNGPLMKEETVGYSLIQHNNPYWPGEKRSRQAFKAPLNGVCNPDQV